MVGKGNDMGRIKYMAKFYFTHLIISIIKISGEDNLMETGIEHAYLIVQKLIADKFSLDFRNLVSISAVNIIKEQGICSVDDELSKDVLCQYIGQNQIPPHCMAYNNNKCSYKRTVPH